MLRTSVVESKPAEKETDDLRLNEVFPALEEYAMSIDIHSAPPHIHGHIPFIVLIIQAMK